MSGCRSALKSARTATPSTKYYPFALVLSVNILVLAPEWPEMYFELPNSSPKSKSI